MGSSSTYHNFIFSSWSWLQDEMEDVELYWLKVCVNELFISGWYVYRVWRSHYLGWQGTLFDGLGRPIVYHLNDSENQYQYQNAGFFVLLDLGVRAEESYHLKTSLFEIVGWVSVFMFSHPGSYRLCLEARVYTIASWYHPCRFMFTSQINSRARKVRLSYSKALHRRITTFVEQKLHLPHVRSWTKASKSKYSYPEMWINYNNPKNHRIYSVWTTF